MADIPKFKYGTEAQILALLPTDSSWVNRAFYYPGDKDYFFQALDGVMKKFAGGESIGEGIKLNNQVIGGVKSVLLESDVLFIPENWDYNTFILSNNGTIINNGTINIM